MTSVVKAEEAIVAVDPPLITDVYPGDTVSINVTITDVTDLWAWQFMLSWNSSVLEVARDPGTGNPLVEEGPFLKSAGNTLFIVVPPEPGELPDISCVLMVEKEVSGSGTLATITFNATALGDTDIIIESILVHFDETIIPVELESGEVIVIPEFPASMILPLFLIATAAIVIMTKIAWSRRRRGYINAL